MFFVFKLFYVSNFFSRSSYFRVKLCREQRQRVCRLQFFLFFFCFCLSLQFAAVDRGRVLHSAMPPFAPHHTTPHSLSRPRIHQSSNCRRAHTRAHTGVVVWKRAQAAYTNTHTENKTAGGSSPQQNILSARRWLRVVVCVCVFSSIYKCIYASVYACLPCT